MPPRKRKAPTSGRGLQPIAESPAKPSARDANGRTKEEAIKHIEDEGAQRITTFTCLVNAWLHL